VAVAHNDSHSAYRRTTVQIEYPWHPLHGRALPIVQRFTKDGLDLYWLEEQAGRSRVVPAWMCSAAACVGMAEPGPPLAAAYALERLAALIKVTVGGHRGRASSEALPVEEAADAESPRTEGPTVARSLSETAAFARAAPPRGDPGPGRPAAGGPQAGAKSPPDRRRR
jgi:hypothetical protein